VALVPDCWDDYWQPRHHLLSRLGSYFNVIWVNPAREWRVAIRNLRATGRRNSATISVGPLIVYEPEFWLPRLYRPGNLANLLFRSRLKRALRILDDRGTKTRILYIWRPEFAQALNTFPFDLTCYHLDDEYSFSMVDTPLDNNERSLLESVDQVFVGSPGLMEKKGHINPHTTAVPNGVDYLAYARQLSEPPDLARIPHPRIGYTGWMKKQLDWALIGDLARRNSQWSFVLVGGVSPHAEVGCAIEELTHLPNVHFLGAKSTQDLAHYPQHFDVCIMPYQQNDYTRYIYPMKLHEYLATGRPTVGTRIRSLESFADVVYLASNRESWDDALRQALSPSANNAERELARRSVAFEHDWENLAAKVAVTLASRLGANYSEALETFLKDRMSRNHSILNSETRSTSR
jgi:hypothetical protein